MPFSYPAPRQRLVIINLLQFYEHSGVTADQVAPLVDKYIAQINEEINLLNAEIEREHILGRADEDDANHALRKMFVEYLGTLEQIKADPAGFDYAQQVNSIRKTAGDMLEDARGEPAKLIAEAQAYRWQKELGEQALAEAFSRHLLAYRASPDIYLLDRYLEVWDEVLQTAASKQVLGIDPNKAKLWLDWKWKSDMMQGVTFEKEKEKK